MGTKARWPFARDTADASAKRAWGVIDSDLNAASFDLQSLLLIHSFVLWDL